MEGSGGRGPSSLNQTQTPLIILKDIESSAIKGTGRISPLDNLVTSIKRRGAPDTSSRGYLGNQGHST